MKNRNITVFRLLSVLLAVLMVISVIGIGTIAVPTDGNENGTSESTNSPSSSEKDPTSTSSPESSETNAPGADSESANDTESET